MNLSPNFFLYFIFLQPPQPAQSWNYIRDANEFGNVCMQFVGNGSEDCLFLNVYTPSNKILYLYYNKVFSTNL